MGIFKRKELNMGKDLQDYQKNENGEILMTKKELVDYINGKPVDEDIYLNISFSDENRTFDQEFTQEEISKIYK